MARRGENPWQVGLATILVVLAAPTDAEPAPQSRPAEVTHGDFDGDGRQDVALGAPYAGTDEQGFVYVYLNSASGLATAPTQILKGARGGEHFGASVQSARDVDGDKIADLLVASRDDMESIRGTGRAQLFRGTKDGLATASSWSVDGLAGLGFRGKGLTFTTVLAGLGDIDGDGYGDVAIGAPEEPNSAAGTGKVLFFRGGPAGLSTTPAFTSDVPNNSGELAGMPAIGLGRAVSAAGDVDGDGYADVLWSAPAYSTGGQLAASGTKVNGGLVCLNDCAGVRAPPTNLKDRQAWGCVIRTAHARVVENGPTSACTACTATQLQNCGYFTAACNEPLGGCTACDSNMGDGGAAPCRSPGKPICAVSGPNKGACRPPCDGSFGSKTPNACTSLVPHCETSGPESGRCTACAGNYGTGSPRACWSERPVCVASGPAKGACALAPKAGRPSAKQSMSGEGLGGFVKRAVRRAWLWLHG